MTSSRRLMRGLSIAATLLSPLAPLKAQNVEPRWPKELQVPEGTLLMYQPQVDSLVRDILAGRSAVSLTKKGQTEPIFGAVWFTTRVVTERDAGTVEFDDLKITRLRVPDFSADDSTRFISEIQDRANSQGLTESLARFTALVEAARTANAEAADLKSTPPKILFSKEPAVLVVYDGSPQLRPIEGVAYQRVVNTPFVVIFDPDSKTYYLTGGRHWYAAGDPLGPWRFVEAAPAPIVQLVSPDSAAAAADSGPPRKILTATEPSELVVTLGAPNFIPLQGTDLLYVSNSDTDLFKDIGSQDYFILLSGRWYRSRTLNGTWTHVRPDQLPATFQKIPSDSPKANVLASVPGTEEADDALADAAIPQTAAIKRSAAKLDVTYDGNPDFQPVQGADLDYAVNASTAVLRINGLYYACDQAVWYVAQDPTGPWAVSDSVPREVQSIPPSNPLYNVKYVDVYQSTPDYVWDGYTPGYIGMFPYYGTVVYGTGWWYPPFIGPVYYWPRPWTWGLHPCYRPWYGWYFGGIYSSGFFAISVGWGGGFRPHYRPGGWYGGGWFGPGGYRPFMGARARPFAGAGYAAGPRVPRNIYNRPEVRPMVAARSASRASLRSAPGGMRPNGGVTRQNNVFVSPDGQVRRRTASGWQTRNGNQWKSDGGNRPTTRPAPSPGARPTPGLRPVPSTPQQRDPMDREYRARTRPMPGSGRSAPAPRAAPRSGGGGGGGGARRH